MKQISLLILTVVLYLSFSSCAQETEKTELKTKSEKMSYALGSNIGASVKPAAAEIDYDALIQGVKDTLEGRTPLLTAAETQQFLGELSTLLRTKSNEKSKKIGEKNMKEGEAFLAENKEKAGVTTTASGLQYEVMKEGSGAKPQKTDRVSVHYAGTLIDGTEFDSSYKRGSPAAFAVTGVIKGWTEVLQLMNVGSKYRVLIPSDLAYGLRGSPPTIGPNATLIFEVELLDIVK